MLKYQAIVKDLQARIENEEYKAGQQLPLEKEMCTTYGVSRITIKRAVDELVKKGLVVKRRGSGTFVKTMDEQDIRDISRAGQFSGFSATFKDHDVQTKVLKFDIVHPTQEIATKLQISTEDFVYDIRRVRILDGKPLVIEYTQMPIQVIPGLKMPSVETSIYSYIQDELHLRIQSAHRIVRALMPTEEEKKYLEIEGVLPILEISQVAFLSDGRAFEYSVAHHRGDSNEFRAVSTR